MKKNKLKPVQLLILAGVFVAAILIAFLLRRFLPESVGAFKGLITWAIVAVLVGIGGFAAGYFMKGKR